MKAYKTKTKQKQTNPIQTKIKMYNKIETINIYIKK